VVWPSLFPVSAAVPSPVPKADSLSIARRSYSELEERGFGLILGYRPSSSEEF
jgi:hypothetical protein